MKIYPESAVVQLEFDKIKSLLAAHCKTDYAKEKAENLRIHTHKNYIELELQQSHEYKLVEMHSMYFPNDFTLNIHKDIRLLGINCSMLTGEQFLHLRRLAESIGSIFRWFDAERRLAYPALTKVIENTYYEKAIAAVIDEVLDEVGNVKDNASDELQRIRMSLYRKRNEQRREFERVIARLAKQGYAADIDESFSNGRRVVAVFSEYKRQVKGILHGESDTRKTAFIEPEETIELNNDVNSLENDERKEVIKVLRALTSNVAVYSSLLQQYHEIVGDFDFIRAKGKLAIDMRGNFPNVVDKAHVELKDAYHPLLYLYNKQSNKPTIPVTLTL